ncbi:chromate efflux transporter [Acanthopleuribacter pedis]|uniref:Chromate efflux transporter n=1 Tax=Acanthopleuribacter pedis TaxID=442870 RepID=A0A8J7U5G2_9BACT|nr:chromate efflux transporter [Acanthopleuribacter pedis]MBO1320819.1 chromate efflux transporter [Acanthopleuribacter pedis]
MPQSSAPRETHWVQFLVFLRLGLTSFGGPVAHLGYFRDELVVRRKWLSESAYADLVGLCQFLPGPASSQVCMSLGLLRGGYLGMALAWIGFTIPSAIGLILFALSITQGESWLSPGALHGLKVVAVAVVANAVWGMGTRLCTDRMRVTFMMIAACFVLLFPYAWGQILVIAVAGLAGLLLIKPPKDGKHEPLPFSVGHRAGAVALLLFFVGLLGLPVLVGMAAGNHPLAVFDAFYRSGSLVFGGGHVVLPLLQSEVVGPGWLDKEAFLAGYGAAQAVPGPLFSFSAFLGAAMNDTASPWLFGFLCLFGIYTPSVFLVIGTISFWERLRRVASTKAALAGINAAVVGILLAALYDPVWTAAIFQPKDFALGLAALVALAFWKAPPWLVVVLSGLIGAAMGV